MLFALRSLLCSMGIVAFILFLPSMAVAQSVDRLVIEGPELENCLVTVRYYKTRQLSKAIALRITLLQGKIEEPLESGFDGVEVYVQSQATPLSASLTAAGQAIASEQLREPGTLRVTAGKTREVEFIPDSIEATAAERSIAAQFIQCINKQTTTQKLVSTDIQSLIDFPCLDVFSRQLHQLIGDVEADKSLVGLVGWDGDGGSRVLAAVLRGSQGISGIRFVLAEGLLIDVQPNCPTLTDDFLVEPLNSQQYEADAQRLARALFAGDANQAHQLYAAQFQDQVTVQQLQQLSDNLRQRYGQSLGAVKVKRVELQSYDWNSQSKTLHVDMILQVGDNRLASRVVFTIPCSRQRVGKANLNAIQFNQILSSSQPALAQLAKDLIEQLPERGSADWLHGKLPAELQAIFQKEVAQALLDRVAQRLSGLKGAIDFDDWTVSQFQSHTLASGPVQFGEQDCYAELQFLGDSQLLGFSFYGPAIAESTMGLFDFPSVVNGTAESFWRHLLCSEAEAAHAMLDKDFQDQFPLEDLKRQLESPLSSSKLQSIETEYVRLSAQVGRPVPLLLTVFLKATFDDASSTVVACDIVLPSDSAGPTIYDFTNDLNIDFPVDKIPVAQPADGEGAQLALSAFQSADVSQLLALIEPSRASAIDQTTLAAYFAFFKTTEGELSAPVAIARTVEYDNGVKKYRANALLNDSRGETLPIEVWFGNGFLERFVVSDPRLNDFTTQLTDQSGVKQRVDAFVKAWFDAEAQPLSLMVSSLQTEQTAGALKSLREQFQRDFGPLKGVEIPDGEPSEIAGTFQFRVTLQGERGSKIAQILVDVGAFGGLVSAVTFQK